MNRDTYKTPSNEDSSGDGTQPEPADGTCGALGDDHTIRHQAPSRGIFSHGLTVLLAGVGVTLLVIAAARLIPISTGNFKQTNAGAAVEVLTDVTQALTQDIERLTVPAMQRGQKLAQSAALVDALRDNNAERITRLCNQAIQHATEIDAIAVFDAEGEIVAINTVYSDGNVIPDDRVARIMTRDYSERGIIMQCVKNSSRQEILEFQTGCDITPALFDSSGLSVAHSVPLYDAAGVQVGVVSTRMRFDRLTSLIDGRSFAGGERSIWFVTDDGRYFDEALNAGGDPPVPHDDLSVITQPLVRRSTECVTFDHGGATHMLHRVSDLSTMDKGGIQVMTRVPESWLTREARYTALAGVVTPGAGGVLFLLLAILNNIVMRMRGQRDLARKTTQQVKKYEQDLEDSLTEARQVANELSAVRKVMDQHTLFSIADRAGKIVDVNEGFCKISGYSREELLGQDHRMLNSGYHPKSFWKDMWRTLQSGKPWRAEVCNRAKDGSLYWVDSTNIPQFDEHGKIIRYVSLRFDVTTNKEAQRQNAQLAAALNASNDCIFIFDAESLDFVYTNHGAKLQIGYTDAELAKMSPVDIKPDYDRGSFMEAIAPLYEKPNTSMVFRTRHQHKDGHCIPVEISLQLMEDLGDHGLFIAAVRDITDQLAAERTIVDAKARLERATNGTSDGLWDYIPATNEVWYADQFKKLVGLEPHEYDQFEPILDSFANLLHPDDKDRTFAAINAHLEDDVPYDVEYRLRMRSGGYRWFRTRGRATRDEHGIATRMAGSICDVQATRDAFELVEQANKAKSEFLANMSHEIRTPMTAILGYSELLCGDLANEPTQAADAVRTIQSNANHLLTIINDILDVSKIEAGQMTVESIETRPTQIISEVLSMVRPRATSKGMDVGVKYETPIPETIQSDPTRLRQILLNLIGNAIKFTEVGSVTIHASCDPMSQQMKLSVVDTGVGMSPQQCEVISKFQAFSQADASTTRKFGGSGLGLRISNALAQMLGGGIEVSSVCGQGSTFTATIATGDLDRVTMLKPDEAISNNSQDRTNDQEQAASKTAAVKPLNGLRILLVEDGPDNQRLISFILKKAGADVTVCENGLIAVQTLENADDLEQPNVVLMDMQMPVLDGYGATQRLRENGYTLPIIGLTAHAMASDRQKCLDAGCDDYATKPIDREILIELVASYAKRVECGRGATTRNDPKPSMSHPVAARRAETTVLLSEVADDPDMAELVDTYVASLGPKAALVAELYSEHRLGELARLAHQLKGASGGYGFPTISEAANKVELQATADPDLRQLALAVDELTGLCAQAVAGRPADGATEPAGAPAMGMEL